MKCTMPGNCIEKVGGVKDIHTRIAYTRTRTRTRTRTPHTLLCYKAALTRISDHGYVDLPLEGQEVTVVLVEVCKVSD